MSCKDLGAALTARDYLARQPGARGFRQLLFDHGFGRVLILVAQFFVEIEHAGGNNGRRPRTRQSLRAFSMAILTGKFP